VQRSCSVRAEAPDFAISAFGHLPFVILLCMKHAKDHDAHADDLVKYLVGKPSEK